MENNHIKSLEIAGFKKFDNLRIDDIGQFNLIIGNNNVGKTTLLEALCVNPNPQKFINCLESINFHIKKNQDLKRSFLLQYFPFNTKKNPPELSIKVHLGDSPKSYFVKLFRNNNNQISCMSGLVHSLIEHTSPQQSITESELNRNQFEIKFPYIPFGPLYHNELTESYSENIQVLVDKKEALIGALSHMLKGIKNVEVNASFSTKPVLLIAENNNNVLMPLANYGDGTIKFFRILLSLFSNNYNYARLMIDELDSGIHYTHLKEFIKSLFKVAIDEKKQIFATTHSKECIEGFTNALVDLGLQAEGRIIRLAETKAGAKAFTMKFDEFETALLADSEIR